MHQGAVPCPLMKVELLFCTIKAKYTTQAEYAETIVMSTGHRNSSGRENTMVEMYDTISKTFCTEASILENAPLSSLSTRYNRGQVTNMFYTHEHARANTHARTNIQTL